MRVRGARPELLGARAYMFACGEGKRLARVQHSINHGYYFALYTRTRDLDTKFRSV
jgi:hypothetical protein